MNFVADTKDHATSVMHPPQRDVLIASMVDRFYANEQATLVSNGLSTDVLCFPSDLHASRGGILKRKITDAISYATAFSDVQELNALLHMAPPEKQQYYLTLGLFLYLSDECNRLGKDTTFLTAMRDAGVNLEGWKDYERKPFLKRAMKAVTDLGMHDSHRDLLHAWYRNGKYMLYGELHDYQDEKLIGTYARLAWDICHQQEKLGMNLAISYALANKEHVEGRSPAEMLAITKQMLTEEGGATLRNRIFIGDTIREKRIRDAIRNAGMAAPTAVPEKTRSDARAILSFLPEQALELLYREGYMFGYDEGGNITHCYPVKNLPDVSAKNNASFRLGKALWLDRYRIMFLSDGERVEKTINGVTVKNDLENNPDLRHHVVGQSLAHETMHLIMSYLDDEEQEPIRAAVEAVSEELKNRKENIPACALEALRTIDTNTLADAMDYKSGLYVNYGKNGVDTRWLEVACNAFGLMQAEYSAPAENPFLKVREGLESLPALKREIDRAMELALTRCRERFAAVEMPSPVQARA